MDRDSPRVCCTSSVIRLGPGARMFPPKPCALSVLALFHRCCRCTHAPLAAPVSLLCFNCSTQARDTLLSAITTLMIVSGALHVWALFCSAAPAEGGGPRYCEGNAWPVKHLQAYLSCCYAIAGYSVNAAEGRNGRSAPRVPPTAATAVSTLCKSSRVLCPYL